MKIQRHWRSMRSIGYLICAIVLVGGLLRTEVGEAATYYVATTGSDQTSCAQVQSQSTPKRTLQSGFGCLQPGDTLHIRAGTYDEGELINPPGGNSTTNRVTIAGYPGDGALAVQIRANGSTGQVFTIIGSGSAYLTLDNLIIDGTGTAGTALRIGTDAHHVRIQNSEIRNSSASGVLTGNTGNEFINVHIHHNGSRLNLDHGIYNVGDHTLIERCVFHDNFAYGIHTYNGGDFSAAHDNIYRNNIAYNHGNSGFLLGSGANNIAYNNISHHNSGGFELKNNAPNNQMYNNTIYGNTKDCIYTDDSSTIIRNNICYQNGTDNITGGANPTQDHNLFNGQNPNFQNQNGNDFHLTAASNLALGLGLNLSSLFTTDFAWVIRPQGGGYDIGAYEYIGNQLPSPSNLRVMGLK